VLAGFVAVLAFAAAPSQAILLNGSYTVNSSSNPTTGLAVGTVNDFGSVVNSTTNSFTGLNVASGATHFQDLFDIFATESPPYSGNDFTPQAISVAFSFTGPAAAAGIITGTTVALANGDGLLHWNGPLTLIFPGQNLLQITMLDAEFSDSFNGIVTAQFRSSIPEPGTLALLGAGVLGGLARRKRAAS
jgi:hypothetical protein